MEIRCQNCQKINYLRPPCAYCKHDLVEAKITDPKIVEMSWWLYRHRRDMRVIYPAVLAALLVGYLIATGSPFAPRSHQECMEDAARSAKSVQAMRVLIDLCNSKFPPAAASAPRPTPATKSILPPPLPPIRLPSAER